MPEWIVDDHFWKPSRNIRKRLRIDVHRFSTRMNIQPAFTEGRPHKVCTLEREPETQLLVMIMLIQAGSLSFNLIPFYAGSSDHILKAPAPYGY